jgi:hypothetical protein
LSKNAYAMSFENDRFDAGHWHLRAFITWTSKRDSPNYFAC